ncbi:MAG TPA: DUF4396 domain-containing protein [Gemmatimonadaceae bacterium]|nr:DUF4396 domain-containing protein [Gemmatimonadaceae bacterium]
MSIAHEHGHTEPSVRRVALRATIHCLTGCAVGEVLGMVIGTGLGWSTTQTIVLSVALAFVFGYAFTFFPLLRSGLPIGVALPLAFASDTASIALMELVDNGIMLMIPGAMESPLSSAIFWVALAAALVIAGIAAFPLNMWLISRGRGHALVHAYHGPGQQSHSPRSSHAMHSPED